MNSRTDKDNVWYEILYRLQQLDETAFYPALEPRDGGPTTR
jgi:hypothetical protein